MERLLHTAALCGAAGATPTVDLVHAQVGDVSEFQLAPLDTLALERLVVGDAALAVEHARGLAEALSGLERDGVRLRMLAKALASERALQALLERILAERIARNDISGVRLVNEALRGCVGRIEKLAAAHRAESLSSHRPVLVVGHADSVQVGSV
jgi:hypothetical protein